MEVAPPSSTLRVLTTEYFDDALELFLDTFANREPSGRALGLSRNDLSDTYPREQMLSLLQHPLSVVAVTTGVTNKVVGVYFADGKYPSEVGTGGPQWAAGPWNALVDSLVDMSEFQGCIPNQFAHGLGIAVAEEWAGKGIGKALMVESVRLAKKHGYKFKLLVLTSKYSLKIATRLGFEFKAFQKYNDFEYNGVKPFTGVDPEHERASFAVLDLDKTQEEDPWETHGNSCHHRTFPSQYCTKFQQFYIRSL